MINQVARSVSFVFVHEPINSQHDLVDALQLICLSQFLLKRLKDFRLFSFVWKILVIHQYSPQCSKVHGVTVLPTVVEDRVLDFLFIYFLFLVTSQGPTL